MGKEDFAGSGKSGADSTPDDKYALTPEEIERLAEHKKYKEKQDEEAKKQAGSWDGTAVQKSYGFRDFTRFAVPFMWRGGFF